MVLIGFWNRWLRVERGRSAVAAGGEGQHCCCVANRRQILPILALYCSGHWLFTLIGAPTLFIVDLCAKPLYLSIYYSYNVLRFDFEEDLFIFEFVSFGWLVTTLLSSLRFDNQTRCPSSLSLALLSLLLNYLPSFSCYPHCRPSSPVPTNHSS